MSFERKKRTNAHPDYLKGKKELGADKKIKVSVIFNKSTHRMIKAVTAADGGKISDLLERLAQQYLKERGKL